ncbi:MAG: hypothetical protein ACRC42_04090 [Mycoplasma sp.]
MLFKDFLINCKKNQNFPQCLIVKTNHCCDYKKITNDYLKFLTCTNNTDFCNECDNCKRINASAYLDLIYLDNEKDEILKEDAMNIQNVFSKRATENCGIKVYAIKHIEKTSKFVLNSLLKFIEDAPEKTYTLLFTKNPNQILPTISSRGTLISIQDVFHDFKHTDTELNDICVRIFDDFSYYQYFIEQYSLENIYNLAKEIVNKPKMINEPIIINKIKDLQKEELNIFFNVLIEISPVDKKVQLLKLIPKIKLNLNKKILAFKILDIMR